MADLVQTYRDNVAAWLKARVSKDPPLAQERELNLALRVLALWRASTVVDEYVARHGLTIWRGPFAGMAYVRTATEGALAPRLLGTYEAELHEPLARFLAGGIDTVIDVGCAEGYYAAGVARMAPGVTVHAFDTDPKARDACRALAGLNGVADRVVVGETFTPDGFQAFAGRRALVLMDVEGAEDELLDPAASPALAQMPVIVEAHEVYRPGVAERLTARFAATHEVARLDLGGRPQPLPDWLKRRNHLDQLLAVWEWRQGPTPWLVMTPR